MQNTDDAQSISLNYATLNSSYNTLLLLYNQIVSDYMSSIIPIPSSSTVYNNYSNSSLAGTEISTSTRTNLNDCTTTCSSYTNSSCLAATYDASSNNCTLYSSITKLKPSSSNYTSIIKKTNLLPIINDLNQGLIDLNIQMQNLIGSSNTQSTLQNLQTSITNNNTTLKQNYASLNEDRKNITSFKFNLDNQQTDTTLKLMQYYYLYLFLIMLVIIAFFVLVKILLTPKSTDNLDDNTFIKSGFFIICALILFIIYLHKSKMK